MTDAHPPTDAYWVAIEHFPSHKLAVKRLMKEDSDFRELCEELEAATAARATVAASGDRTGELLRSQWTEIVERLVDEISVSIATHEAGVLKDRNNHA